MPKGKWYLAAPFFNPAQIALVEQIEAAFKMYDVQLFSPRQHPANKPGHVLSDEDARDIFQRNWEAILGCTDMIAVVDWLLPPGHELYVLGWAAEQEIISPAPLQGSGQKPIGPLRGQKIAGPLNIPDTGTVWEMGAAFGEGAIDIFMFTTRPPTAALNVMLSQGAKGVFAGIEELNAFLSSGCNRGLVGGWKGKHQ